MSQELGSHVNDDGSMVIERGSTLNIPLTLTDANGAVRNLTGYTAKMQVRKDYADPDVLLELTHLAGLLIEPLLGKVTIQRTAAQTAAFSWSRGVYDVELIAATDPPGTEKLLAGTVIVGPEATK